LSIRTAGKRARRRALVSSRRRGSRRALVAQVTVASVGIAGLLGGSGATVATAAPSIPEGHAPSPELAAAVADAAKSCPALSPSRLAAQLMVESGLNPERRAQGGARGVAGLTDSAWLRWKPSDSAQRTDDAANVEALAHRMCDLVGQIRHAHAGGDLWRSALAAHRTDVDAVRVSKGVPPAAESYVDTVAAYAAWYGKLERPSVQVQPTPSGSGEPSKPAGPPSAAEKPPPTVRPPVKRSPVKRSAVKTSPVKRSPVKRSPVKRSPVKMPPTKKPHTKPSPQWHTVTIRNTVVLRRNGSWRSDRLSLTLSAAGDIVLYDRGKMVWHAGTANRGATNLVFQADGHLVLYTDGMATVWSSRTAGHDGAVLLLGANGRVSIVYRGRTLWSIP
jgi:hypothetical protein